MELCKSKLDEINDIQEYNQQKMIKAFQEAGVIFRLQQAMAMTISAEMLSTVCMPMLLTPRTHL